MKLACIGCSWTEGIASDGKLMDYKDTYPYVLSKYLKQNQINFPSSVYVKKIGYVSSEMLNIKIQDKNICNIRVEELTEKFNNSISDYF